MRQIKREVMVYDCGINNCRRVHLSKTSLVGCLRPRVNILKSQITVIKALYKFITTRIPTYKILEEFHIGSDYFYKHSQKIVREILKENPDFKPVRHNLKSIVLNVDTWSILILKKQDIMKLKLKHLEMLLKED